ncbi:MAG: histidine kinase [Bacteroidota bacterium]
MQSPISLLQISFGALFILGIFHFTIYLQQKDKAFRNYAFYLLVMATFNIIRLLDARLSDVYPLSYYAVETLDPILSNFAFLMYVNFLGVVLNISRQEKLYYNCWKFLQVFIPSFLMLYFFVRLAGDQYQIGSIIITVASFCCMCFGLLLTLRLLQLRKATFFQFIIAGTLVSVTGVIAGLILNVFVYKDNLAFGGLYFLEISMLVESVFLSAALGYRLKLAYRDKEIYQQSLLEETQKREALAVQTATLLQQQLDIQEVRSSISKDLHDDIGSSLSSLQIYSSLAKKLMDEEPGKAKEMLQQMAVNTEGIMSDMEDIIWSMQRPTSEIGALETRIKHFANSLLMVKGIVCSFTFDENVETACTDMSTRKNILLIAKEAINNAAKYSNAQNVTIDLARENGNIVLVIKDDGKGFVVEQNKKGNGLSNMDARAKAMGGSTVIVSGETGTSIMSTMPIPNISDRAV